MTRFDEAVAEHRKAIAAYERRAALDPASVENRRSVALGYRDLARLHSQRGDFKSSSAVYEKTLPFLEADYAAHSDDVTTADVLRSVLLALRNQYTLAGDHKRAIAASQGMVKIIEQETAGQYGEFVHNQRLASAVIELATAFQRTGRREDSLVQLRRALAILDKNPIEMEQVPVHRLMAGESYIRIAAGFNMLRRYEESVRVCKLIVDLLEAPSKDSNLRERSRRDLLDAYQVASLAFINLDELTSALDYEERYMKLAAIRAPLDSPGGIGLVGLHLGRIGQLQDRMGNREAAGRTWREALSMFRKSAVGSEQQLLSDRKNVAALRNLGTMERYSAYVLEKLGDLREALRVLESAHSRALGVLNSDPGTTANIEAFETSRANAVRMLWLLEGERGDYRAFFENRKPASEDIRAALAKGWQEHAAFLGYLGGPTEKRMEAAKNAVALSRQLVAERRSAAHLILLAHSLEMAGDASFAAGAFRQSQDDYLEARAALNDAKESGPLPSLERTLMATLETMIAGNEERLRDGTRMLNAKQK